MKPVHRAKPFQNTRNDENMDSSDDFIEESVLSENFRKKSKFFFYIAYYFLERPPTPPLHRRALVNGTIVINNNSLTKNSTETSQFYDNPNDEDHLDDTLSNVSYFFHFKPPPF